VSSVRLCARACLVCLARKAADPSRDVTRGHQRIVEAIVTDSWAPRMADGFPFWVCLVPQNFQTFYHIEILNIANDTYMEY